MSALKLSLVFTIVQAALTIVLFTKGEKLYFLGIDQLVVILAFLSTVGAIVLASRAKTSAWGMLLFVLNILCLFLSVFLLYMTFFYSFRV